MSKKEQDVKSLQEALVQQQAKISALKQILLKSDNSQGKTEKVKSITKQLTKLKAKARGAFYGGETSATTSDFVEPNLSHISTPNLTPVKLQQQLNMPNATEKSPASTGSEKVQLLRQQMEQNKLRLAQRASSKLHLEQLVSELKEKLDSTQQRLDDTSQLGKSMSDLSESLPFTTPVSSTSVVTRHDQRHRSVTDLSSQPAFNLEKERIKFLENRCRLLEKQLEKERQGTTKQNEVDVAEQMKCKQELENRVQELEKLLQESEQKQFQSKQRIAELEQDWQENYKTVEENSQKRLLELEQILQQKREEIESKSLREQELINENSRLRAEISDHLNNQPSNDEDNEKHFIIIELRNENTRLSKRVAELEEETELLETARCDLASSNIAFKERVEQLEEELQKLTAEMAVSEKLNEESKNQRTGNLTENTESQIETEMAKQIQELQERNEEVLSENDKLKEAIAAHENIELGDEQITTKISNLEATIASQREDLTARQNAMNKLEEELMEKTIEFNVLNANFKVLEEKLQALNKSKIKPLFSTAGDGNAESEAELHAEVQLLKQKLDESNKAMIKLKLKCKQSEKQIEKLKNNSNLHADVIELQKTNEELQQRITELEDEKGQWQLMQIKEAVEKDETKIDDTTNAETIRILEEQKHEQSQQIEILKEELKGLQRQALKQERVVVARVESELSEIQLEEKIEQQQLEIRTLQHQLEEKEVSNATLQQQNEELQVKKQNLEKKLEHYLSENMELLDKVEKLSKSSSSAESIEIVDRLTQQERAEMDEFNKRLGQVQQKTLQENTMDESSHPTSVSEVTQTEMGFELNESLVKLREESSELMSKVEMFTTERREVLEKMENLTAENQDLLEHIEELTQQKIFLENKIAAADEIKTKLESEMLALAKEKEALTTQVAESSAQKAQLSRELTSMQKSSEIVAALDSSDGSLTLFDKCEKSLSKLETELEAYRRANDKNSKFNASKKLAKEAKNAHTQLSELLVKVKEASTAVETVTVVETVVAVTAPNGKALAEYEQLTAQNRELKMSVEKLKNKLQELEDNSLHGTISELASPNDNKEKTDEAEKLKQSLEKSQELEVLKATVDELREQLTTVNLSNESKSGEITRLHDELKNLQKISFEFEKMLNDKEAAHADQIEQFTRLRKELEGKCQVYEGEMEILQTLVTEQKQQLIEAFKEHEHEMNMNLLDLQQRDEQITQLRSELAELRQASRAAGAELSNNLQKECENLRESLRINKALNAEQIIELANKQETIDLLNQQLIDLYKSMEENTNKVIEKEDEIGELQQKMFQNKTELERLRKDNEEQKVVVDKLLNELHSHKETKQQIIQLESEMQTLNETKTALEQSNKDLEKRCREQLEKMKKYVANLKKRATQCQELEAKIQKLESKSNDGELQQELAPNVVLLNERISDYEYKVKTLEEHLIEIQEALQAKTIEKLESMENIEKLEKEINSLRNDLKQRDEAIIQLQNALSASQEQTAVASDSAFVGINSELNYQVEKTQFELLELREILKTRNQEIDELKLTQQGYEKKEMTMHKEILALQTQLTELKTKSEFGENQLQQLQEQHQKLSEELSAKSLKFEKSKAVIKERNNQIHRLQAQLKELQEKLAEQPEEMLNLTTTTAASASDAVPKSDYEALQQAYDNLNAKYNNEKHTFEQTIARLETLHDGIQAKLQEDMSYIETIEQENTRFKEKICKLEECVNTFEERRSSMERKANLLNAQMQTRTDEYVKAEDELIYRLNMLSEHDEVIAQRLMESLEEKDGLQDRLDKTQRKFTELTAQYNKLEKEYKNFKEQSESQMNTELESLREKLKANEAETTHMRAVYDAKLAAKTTEIDELENDLSEQLERMNKEKRELQENLEKSRDECNVLKDEVMRLNESLNAADQAKQESERELSWLRMQNENSEQDQYELQELRMQSMQDKTELDNLRQQIETLANNHQSEVEALRIQIAELDSLRMQVGQNQTDDQVFIETENKRLSDLLTEKEGIIAEYQRQNLQLQMDAAAAARNTLQQQPPDIFASIGAEATQQQNISYEQELADKNALIRRLQDELESLREESRAVQRAASTDVPNASDIIPAPPMFFASSQVTPSPFDEIVQRRQEQPHFTAPSALNFLPDVLDQPTIEDLQRNVSDLEKYTQELEHKLAARNNQEEELRQSINESHTRQVNAEMEVKRMEEQLQQMNQRLQEGEQIQLDLKKRIGELEAQLKERDDELCAATTNALINAQDTAQHDADYKQRLKAAESILDAREAQVVQLTHQLDAIQNFTKNLESQIIQEAETDSSKPPSLNMFFGDSSTTGANVFEDIITPPAPPEVSDVPVVEEVIVPKKAYLCYPEGSKNVPKTGAGVDSNLGFDEDVWGGSDDAHWGSNEAVAEANHFAQTQTAGTTSLLSREQQLELELQTSNDRIKELQKTLDESEMQKQKLQEKLAKSLKVVSKYKSQNEELKKNSTGLTPNATGFFDDLDVAIQDELKQQITKLEAELAEHIKQQKEAAIEKSKLLNRIDILTAGNERMAEMKERQDMDMDMYKTRISELQQKLSKLEDWDNATGETGSQMITVSKVDENSSIVEVDSSKFQELEARIEALLAEVDDLNGDKQELQALLDVERSIQNNQADYQKQLWQRNEEIETLKEINKQLQKEMDELKRSLESARTEAERCDDLKQMCMEFENKLQNERAKHAKDSAILESKCCDLKQELDKVRMELATASTPTSSAGLAISDLANNSATFDELLAQLQEKDAEIIHLKQRIEDLMREDQTEKLVLEILTKNQEIHMLKIQVKNLEDDKQELEHNLAMQITKEMQKQQKDEPNDHIDALKRLKELEAQVEELQAEKFQMEQELNVLNAHVLNSLEMEDKLKKAALDLDMKSIEIKELRKTLEALRESGGGEKVLPQQESDVTALNTRWEAVVEQRCSEIAQMWRTHLEQREIEFKIIEQRLKMEIETLQKAQQQIQQVPILQQQQQQHHPQEQQQQRQQNISVDMSAAGSASSTPVSTASATSPSASADTSSSEVSKDCTPLHIINEADADELISKMQTALENQEMEIVSLKEQLAIRSAEYARLAAQYDPFKLQTGSNLDSPRNNENKAPVVPKSELDLAMYILHQRDMRIEEMTVELVALLEERDTLQLKLSNTLRQMEAIKSHINVEPPQFPTETAGTATLGTAISTTSIDSPLKSISSVGTDDPSDELHQKLSQLQTVHHSKDKHIQEERERRGRQMERMRQIDRIQQDVARIPPAAVSELIGTDITQSNQSPSSVLLNWLWGNKPPGSDGGNAPMN